MMRKSSCLLLVSFLALAIGAGAEEMKPLASLDEKLSIEFAAPTPVRDVLASLAGILGVESELDPALEGDVVVQLRDVSARTTLDVVCEMAGCRWWMDKGPPRRLHVKAGSPQQAEETPPGSLDTRVSLALADAPAEQVFKSFASIGGWKLDIERPLITVELEDMKVRDALDVVCRAIECSWAVEREGALEVLRITWDD